LVGSSAGLDGGSSDRLGTGGAGLAAVGGRSGRSGTFSSAKMNEIL